MVYRRANIPEDIEVALDVISLFFTPKHIPGESAWANPPEESHIAQIGNDLLPDCINTIRGFLQSGRTVFNSKLDDIESRIGSADQQLGRVKYAIWHLANHHLQHHPGCETEFGKDASGVSRSFDINPEKEAAKEEE